MRVLVAGGCKVVVVSVSVQQGEVWKEGPTYEQVREVAPMITPLFGVSAGHVDQMG